MMKGYQNLNFYDSRFGDLKNQNAIKKNTFNVSMRASYGRSNKGSAAIHTVPNIRSMNISICCAVNKSGILHYSTETKAYNRYRFTDAMGDLIEKLQKRKSTKLYLSWIT